MVARLPARRRRACLFREPRWRYTLAVFLHHKIHPDIPRISFELPVSLRYLDKNVSKRKILRSFRIRSKKIEVFI